MALTLDRRRFLIGAGALMAAAAAPRLVFAAPGAAGGRDTIVSIFLRGGVDGLNVVAPYAESAYYKLRPQLALFPPDSGTDAALPLDGHFGLNPAFAAVEPLFREGKLAFVHAAGLDIASRSHAVCRDRVARADPGGGIGGNWLDRHLSAIGGPGALTSVGMGSAMPAALQGSPYATGLGGTGSFSLRPSERSGDYATSWSRLFGVAPQLGAVSRSAFEAASAIAAIDAAPQAPEMSADYPQTPFGRQLRQVARLIKSNAGLEVACLELGGWDHHDRGQSRLALLLAELGTALAAFDADLGAGMAAVDVVVLSEFGRRAAENASLGTDHGSGGLMMLLGGGVAGGQVYTLWPGLGAAQLRDGGLAPTIDTRTVLGELLVKRRRDSRLDQVFPGFKPQPFVGAFRAFAA